MKKFLLIELIISAICTAFIPQAWSGGILGYILHVIATMIIPLLFGYILALFVFLIEYIISRIFKMKFISIHKIAFFGFLLMFVIIESQNLYEAYFQKNGQDIKETIEETIEKEFVSGSKNTVSKTPIEQKLDKAQQDTEKKEMQQYMRGVLEEIGRKTEKDLAARAEKINIPNPILDKTYLLYSKEKLSEAISKQDNEVKQYKEEVKNMLEELKNENADYAFSKCTAKYREDLCKETMKPFKRALVKLHKMLSESIGLYVDYMEEELKAFSFIDDNYDKFRITEKGPYFIDSELQAQNMTNMKEVERKFLLFNNKVMEISNMSQQ